MVGINVDHGVLLEYASEYMPINEGVADPPPPSPYKGGEERKEHRGRLAHCIMAAESAGYDTI